MCGIKDGKVPNANKLLEEIITEKSGQILIEVTETIKVGAQELREIVAEAGENSNASFKILTPNLKEFNSIKTPLI